MMVPKKFHYQFAQSIKNFKKHIDFGVEKICRFENYPVIESEVSRFVVDLNRERDDIKSEQGVIINKDWDNFAVLKQELNKKEIEERLVYYDSFYKKLKSLLSESKNGFLLDSHSMDSKNHGDGTKRPDICLANNFGKTCPKKITEIFKEEFGKSGYWVEENNPYSGNRAKIIRFANEFSVSSLAVEFNKGIYMDEKTFELKLGEINKLREILLRVLGKIGGVNNLNISYEFL